MGRAGGGGGGRSSGGGGMRHSGGHSGGGSRSSFSGGSRGHSSAGGFSGGSSGNRNHASGFSGNRSSFSDNRRGPDPFGPRPVRPVIVNPVHTTRRSGCGTGCGGGGLGSILLLVVVLMIWSVVVSSCTASGKTSSGGSSAEIQTSTIHRERLNSGSLVNVGWYTDNLDWIRDPDKLEKGLAYFYKRTGVSPYLYLTEDVSGVLDPTQAQLDAFAGELYDTLFRDEAHFLVVFQEHDGVYNTRYVCGLEARAVMDDEACEILLDYLDAYYFGDYDDEEYFAKAFTDAADRIMDTKVPARVYVTGTAVVIGIGVLVWLVWKKLRDRREERVRNAEAAGPESPPDLTSELLENADAQTRFPGNKEE